MRYLLFLVTLSLALAGCGGGGGGGGTPTATLTGRVLQVSTGGAPSPRASVQVGTATTLTDATDGSFTLTVPQGTTSVTVDSLGISGVWAFAIPAATGTVDVGDFWIGPNRVTLRGRVVRSTDGAVVANARVNFGGRTGTTNSLGNFSLLEVAYDNANQTAFWGIVGSVSATGFFANQFSASPNVASAGVVNVGDVPLTPTDDDDPPPPPFNITGRILPSGDAPGTIVRLKLAGVTQRTYNVDATGRYYFWISPGTYTVEATKGARVGTATVTLSQANQVITRDVTLP